MMRPFIIVALWFNVSLAAIPCNTGCGMTGGTLVVDAAPEYECLLRACPAAQASCMVLQCFDDAGNPPEAGWSPDGSCLSPQNVAKAEECGVQFCCDEVGQ